MVISLLGLYCSLTEELFFVTEISNWVVYYYIREALWLPLKAGLTSFLPHVGATVTALVACLWAGGVRLPQGHFANVPARKKAQCEQIRGASHTVLLTEWLFSRLHCKKLGSVSRRIIYPGGLRHTCIKTHTHKHIVPHGSMVNVFSDSLMELTCFCKSKREIGCSKVVYSHSKGTNLRG